MKKNSIFLAGILFLLTISFRISNAQSFSLSITNITGFPIVPDSAFEGTLYNPQYRVKNLGNTVITNDTIFIELRNDSATVIQSVIASIPIQSLLPNDSIDVTSNYSFLSSNYRTGSNIVVVWPRLSNTGIVTTLDSVIFNVFFVPLASTNQINQPSEEFSFFPNPVSNEIFIISKNESFIERVRILNEIGQEVFCMKRFSKHLNVTFLPKGFYFLEIKARHGVYSRKKFIKL